MPKIPNVVVPYPQPSTRELNMAGLQYATVDTACGNIVLAVHGYSSRALEYRNKHAWGCKVIDLKTGAIVVGWGKCDDDD